MVVLLISLEDDDYETSFVTSDISSDISLPLKYIAHININHQTF
ncbi:hypothetical protein [Staphylococcus schweitzeri]|nr:hypothetical protein [Staphylococcus schweitzeri]